VKVKLSTIREFMKDILYWLVLVYMVLIAYKVGVYNERLRLLNEYMNHAIMTCHISAEEATMFIKELQDNNVLATQTDFVNPMPNKIPEINNSLPDELPW